MTREISLTQGKSAIVDDDSYGFLAQFKWYAYKPKRSYTWYAFRQARIDGKKTKVAMHRVIANAPGGVQVDHKDGNGLNNTKNNLRLCTPQRNHFNSSARRFSSSKYKGVVLTRSGRWQAQIGHDGAKYYLGTFVDESDAAKAYDAAALELFGEFARINFPQEAE